VVTPTTWLAPDRYLELLVADAQRLAAVADGHLDDPVPPCPGWTVADVVQHTGEVYLHKVACIQLGRRPLDSEYEHGPGEGQDLLEWFGSALSRLLAELTSREPASAAYTWYPPEQNVAFWIRRMAQETVVHRVDAESASGQVTAAPDDLAVDGIDEVLDLFVSFAIGEDPEEDLAAYLGRSLLVRTGASAWRVRVDETDPAHRIPVERGAGPAQATVSGEPSELLLWLWGRRPDTAVTSHGDPAAVAAWRELLVRGTQ
jgi:uncharacterized protein (TIGR03083 family)